MNSSCDRWKFRMSLRGDVPRRWPRLGAAAVVWAARARLAAERSERPGACLQPSAALCA